jgi:DNA-binding response OmpR family regulator
MVMDVLLVEDEPLVREILTETLEEAGLDVAEMPTGEAALQATVEAAKPAVVVTDVDLGPGMSGFALAREARRRWPDVGVVYISGRPSNLQGHALDPRERFLPKPFMPDALVRTVRCLMGPPGMMPRMA